MNIYHRHANTSTWDVIQWFPGTLWEEVALKSRFGLSLENSALITRQLNVICVCMIGVINFSLSWLWSQSLRLCSGRVALHNMQICAWKLKVNNFWESVAKRNGEWDGNIISVINHTMHLMNLSRCKNLMYIFCVRLVIWYPTKLDACSRCACARAGSEPIKAQKNNVMTTKL
jgi:hypothetical protein